MDKYINKILKGEVVEQLKKTGRRYIGIEKEPKYVELANNRILNTVAKDYTVLNKFFTAAQSDTTFF